MAVTNFSPLLGLALPTTGDLSGTWGTTVNDSITQLLDSAVAGTTTLSADTDVTLSTTNGAANQARNAVILWTASNGANTRNITAPAQSKAYLVINSGTGSIVIRGAGPTTGVTVPASARALVAWNGSDFVKVASNPTVLTADVTGTLPIANGGTGTTSTTFANLTTNVTGTLPEANGGTGESTYTSGQLLIGNAAGGLTKATLTQGANIAITNGDGSITIAATGVGAGDVVGPASATNNVLVAFDGTTGKLIKVGSASSTTVDGTNLVGYKNIPAVADKTTAYTLAVGDVGKVVGVGSGGSIEIPDTTFAAGDAVLVFNNTTGDITITCTITTAYIAGADADVASVTLATRGVCNILFISGTVCVITGNVS
jgi:hypothetical protein